jgi:hypothetical protein
MFGNHYNSNLSVSITATRAEELLDAVTTPVSAHANAQTGEVVFDVAGAQIVRNGNRWVVTGRQDVVARLALGTTADGADYIRDFYEESQSSSAE